MKQPVTMDSSNCIKVLWCDERKIMLCPSIEQREALVVLLLDFRKLSSSALLDAFLRSMFFDAGAFVHTRQSVEEEMHCL